MNHSFISSIIAFIALLTFLTSTTYAALTFNLITDKAPWPTRIRANLITTIVDVRVDNSVSIPKGSLVLLGGQTASYGVTNDIWSSTDGIKWNFVAGMFGTNMSSYPTTSFNPRGSSSSTIDPNTGRIYKIGGGDTADIWYSDNIVKWQKQDQKTSTLPGRSYPGVAVDTTGRIIVAGGYVVDDGNHVLADVWSSVDQGKNWTNIMGYNASNPYVGNNAAPWAGVVNGAVNKNYIGGRGSFDFESWKNPITNLDVLFLWTGSAREDVAFNDVWVSGDDGVTWGVVCRAAPWIARNDDVGTITSNGIMVVAAGRPPRKDNVDQPDLNDVWASLDGGWTWGQCSAKTEFEDRRYLSATVSGDGYFWILGGQNENNTYFNDVWRSSFSFNDVAAVAAHCNLPMPACDPGLICFPGSGVIGDDGVVRCAATALCLEAESAGSSSSSAVAALAVLFVLSTLVAAYALYYIYKLKKGSRGGNLSSSDSLGSLNDENSLYKPLTIHS